MRVKGMRLSGADKVLMKGCEAINVINELERFIRERVGIKTTVNLGKKRSIEIENNINKAKEAIQEVLKCISEGSKANRREDV